MIRFGDRCGLIFLYVGVFALQHRTQTPALAGIDKHLAFADFRLAGYWRLSIWESGHDFRQKGFQLRNGL